MEGITLVAIPQRPSSTAPGQIPTQLRQIRDLKSEYDTLTDLLLAEEMEAADINSPLALLLTSIAEKAINQFGMEDEQQFFTWLEACSVTEISGDAGQAATTASARLADTVDELDGILLSALEELNQNDAVALNGAMAEQFLTDLWQRTFTAYAAAQEYWLERAFIRRGRSIVENIYPDADERKRLYQYGFTPYVGRRFEAVAPDIRAIIESATNYGAANADDKFSAFSALGTVLASDRGFGFRVRQTVTDQNLLENWEGVLAWWMQRPGAASPDPKDLRSWQRFVADNVEFRLGVAVGAVVAHAWSVGAGDPLEVPNLGTWRKTSGLPWFGFWARELLRWGTVDPFVAFALAQGLSRTRDEAAGRREEFVTWLNGEYKDLEPEDMIDPQLFLEWQRSLPRAERVRVPDDNIRAELTGTTGQRGIYRVIPVEDGEQTNWIDAAGYNLAQSPTNDYKERRWFARDDFELHTGGDGPVVKRVFSTRTHR